MGRADMRLATIDSVRDARSEEGMAVRGLGHERQKSEMKATV